MSGLFCISSHHSFVRYSTSILIFTVLSYLTILLFKRYLFLLLCCDNDFIIFSLFFSILNGDMIVAVPTPQPSRPLALPPPSKSEAAAAAPAPTPPRQFSGRYGGGLPPEVNRSGVATSRRASTEEADDYTVAETEVSFATMSAAAALAAAATTGQVQEPSSPSSGRRSPARDVVPSRARSREDRGRGRGGEGSGSRGDGHGNPQTPPPRSNPGMLLSHASDNDLYTAYGEPLSRSSSRNGSGYHVGAVRVLPPGVASSPIVGPTSSTGQGPHKLSGDEVEFDLVSRKPVHVYAFVCCLYA